MNNHESTTADRVKNNNPLIAAPVNFLMSPNQALSLLRSFLKSSFSTNGPAGYEYQSRTLYTPEQLFTWLSKEAHKTKVAISVESALAQRMSERMRHDQGGDDDDDEIEVDEDDDLDDDGNP